MKREFLSFPRSAKLYLISQFLMAGYYTWPFWYGFAAGRITPVQFGIYLAIVHIAGLFAEVPTGAFADSYGRRLSAFLGALCCAVAPLIVFVGGNFQAYVLSAAMTGIGGAFVSGSLESLVYDLPDMTAEIFRRVMVQDTFFWQSGLITATALGGLLYQTNNILPFLAEAASFVLAAIVILQVASDRQLKVADSNKQTLSNYVSTTTTGFMHLFKTKSIHWLIVFGVSVSVLIWMGIEYINEAAMIHYSLQPELRGLILAVSKVIALLVLNFIVLKRVKSDRQKLTYLFAMCVVVFGLYSTGIISLFLTGFVLFNLISSVGANFIKPMLHEHIDSRWRATSISTYSFVANLVQAAAAILIGFALQAKGVVYVQQVMLAVFLVIGGLAYIKYLPKLAIAEKSAADVQPEALIK